MSFDSFFDYPGTDSGQAQANDLAFLPNLPDEGWEKLLAAAEMCRYAAGDVVMRAGERDRALYIVAGGELESGLPAGRRSAGAGERVLPGAVIGAMEFLDGGPRPVSVRAMTECELLRLSHDDFEALAAREPALARAVLFDLGRLVALRLRRSGG